MKKNKWEMITNSVTRDLDGKQVALDATLRLRIEGIGWLVNERSILSENGTHVTSNMCFVPDRNGTWIIEDDKKN